MKATTKLRTAFAAVVLPALTLLSAAVPAAAAPQHPCDYRESRCHYIESSLDGNDDGDDGGENAHGQIGIWIGGAWGGGDYRAEFYAYDERIYLRDDFTDHRRAEIYITYYGAGGPYHYHYYTGSDRWIELGSDEDLSENNRIVMRLCIEDYACTDTFEGRT